jgi:hypothetical protein
MGEMCLDRLLCSLSTRIMQFTTGVLAGSSLGFKQSRWQGGVNQSVSPSLVRFPERLELERVSTWLG